MPDIDAEALRGLSEEDRGALKLVETYGDGMDFSGRRVSASVRKVVVGLIGRGLLAGSHRNCCITDAGREALRALEARAG